MADKVVDRREMRRRKLRDAADLVDGESTPRGSAMVRAYAVPGGVRVWIVKQDELPF